MMQFISHNKMFSQVLGFIFLVLFTAPTFANNVSSQQLWKGVVIDSNDAIAYIINPNGGIDSISVSTGLLNWHTDSANYPILVNDSLLIAQVDSSEVGKISLVAIDTKTGNVTENKLINIPKNIVAKVSQGLHQEFDIYVDPDAPLSGKIQWQYKKQTVQGMLAEKDQRDEAELKYGEISLSNNQKLTDAKSKVLSQKPPTKNAAIEGKFIGNIEGRQFKSHTQEHILLSNLKTNTSDWNKYQWQIFDMNGRPLGQLDNSVSYNAFLVIDDIILYMSNPYIRYKKSETIEAPLSLHAYSLTSGNHLWNNEIRDLKFKGKMPH